MINAPPGDKYRPDSCNNRSCNSVPAGPATSALCAVRTAALPAEESPNQSLLYMEDSRPCCQCALRLVLRRLSRSPSNHLTRSPTASRVDFLPGDIGAKGSRDQLAITRARGRSRAIATAMHPDPVQTSTMVACRSAGIRRATYSTSNSVSGL